MDLKKLIKAEKSPRFDDVASDELTVWSVSYRITMANRHIPVLLTSMDSATELDPMDDIADVFQNTPPKKTVQINVQRPPPANIANENLFSIKFTRL